MDPKGILLKRVRRGLLLLTVSWRAPGIPRQLDFANADFKVLKSDGSG